MQSKSTLLILTFCFYFYGCAGYKFRVADNPFAQYGINSVAVPMFLNNSNIPRIGVNLSHEIIKVLDDYPALKLYPGEYLEADGILLGIIDSKKTHEETFQVANRTFTDGKQKESLGSRRQFYIPSNIKYSATLQLILIRHPTGDDVKLAKSDLRAYLQSGPKIVFNETFTLDATYDLSISENNSPDDGGVVNATKNSYALEYSLKGLAVATAQNVRRVLLDAF
jgi:hypothetical protein